MRRFSFAFCCLLMLLSMPTATLAALGASATLTPQQLGPNSYEYSLTLTNTGTTPIGTFWFSWIPGYDLLPTAPTSIISPTGWKGTDQREGIGSGSIQWVNTTAPLLPGKSQDGFKFDSPDTPDQISGTSFFAGLPVEQSYVYIGAPETDPGATFVATTVTPEPASMALLAVPALLLVRRRRS